MSLYPVMVAHAASDEFARRYYRWALADAARELREGFPPVGAGRNLCRQAVGGHRRVLAPERELAAPGGLHAGRQRQALQQRAGDDEVELAPLGVFLQPRGRVEDVADEDDLLPEVAQLAARDGATVQPAAEAAAPRRTRARSGRAWRAIAVRIAKKQATQLAARTPAASGQVITTSSPAYW